MVKILIFVPRLDMKPRFLKSIEKLNYSSGITIELTHVFGTPDSLAQNIEADIIVVRGMTSQRLKSLLPDKHMVELQMTSFDILDALIQCKEKYAPKKISLCMRRQTIKSLHGLEELCNAQIDLYDVTDQVTAEEAIAEGLKAGTDVFVGAGTVCGLCDKEGIPYVHIDVTDDAIDQALLEAVNAARTLELERVKSNMIRTILNNSSNAIIGLNESGIIQAINNKAYLTYHLSTLQDMTGVHIDKVCSKLHWKYALDAGKESDELIRIKDKPYFIQYKPIIVGDQKAGTVIFTQSAEDIVATESKIRRSLSEKGLTAKYKFEDIIGRSSHIQENIVMAKRYSKVDSNVLIIGETGTGKELFAHSIHSESRRNGQPFVALNCAALPESLLESELFGYVEGAFSGAAKGGKVGLFELAHKGTIFLDEIGELPIALQAKLLRVLQEKEIRRIGSDRVQPIDVRVISATNINIDKQIAEGKFRADLYYRLNLLDIIIPPLRYRKEDIQDMVDYYFSRFACELGRPAPRLTKEAAHLLGQYDWPGNVRELRNICERLTVLNDSEVIKESDILQLKAFRTKESEYKKQEPETVPLEENLYRSLQPKKKKKDLASELGVSRTTLWRMMKKEKEMQSKNKS